MNFFYSYTLMIQPWYSLMNSYLSIKRNLKFNFYCVTIFHFVITYCLVFRNPYLLNPPNLSYFSEYRSKQRHIASLVSGVCVVGLLRLLLLCSEKTFFTFVRAIAYCTFGDFNVSFQDYCFRNI